MSDRQVKPVPLAHQAEAALVRAALALFRALPPAAASRLGGGVARTIGPLLPGLESGGPQPAGGDAGT